ncbi:MULTISPECIES: TlpA family protein disulfide reductase [Crystallibacter]|uniref:TlpA family protein disulfide reductase n=1 Tax=Crystallibacter TaxID=3456524 RepID=UPI0014741E5E|nr:MULTISPECIES: TlpA disulfide reductase family protein [unclassified Arthrobacter]MCW2133443.1 Thiol-disulfide isomerase or thioredoxin [Arthrobacter sp. VKM Ac-2550]NMR31937.1 TlpA family protein disulfide reductase [Arthrobacter sp. SF27]
MNPRIPVPPGTPRPGRRGVLLGTAFAALLLAGCAAPDSLAAQAKAGDNKNYIAGDGSVSEYAPAGRGKPVQLTGRLYDGTAVGSTEWADQVVVLNFWYAACAPCRVEAADLEALHQEFQDDGVLFYGVNLRDSAATAAAFERNFGTTYPSFDDTDGGILLVLTEYVPPQAVPTTLVLDRQTRVAARILGVAQKSTLKALISDTAKGRTP